MTDPRAPRKEELRLALELDHAERYLCQEIANAAQPIVRKLLMPHAWSLSGDAARLVWLHGIWMRGRRGMLLTRDERSALWVSLEAPADTAREAGTAALKLHWLERVGGCGWA